MILGTFLKQPAETLDYDIDYSQWMVPGDAIGAATATPDGTGLEVVSVFINQQSVKLWVRGGNAGTTYKITITATTDDGRIKQDEIKIKVKEI